MAVPDSPANPFGTALRVLGAVTGIAAVMTFVGGAMVWIRFDELRLPADQAVSLLPKQLLLIVGAHAMAVPVGVGVFVAVIFVLINAMDPKGELTKTRKTVLWLFAIPSAIVAIVLVWPYDVWQLFVTVCVLIAGLVVLGITLTARVPNAILPSGRPRRVDAVRRRRRRHANHRSAHDGAGRRGARRHAQRRRRVLHRPDLGPALHRPAPGERRPWRPVRRRRHQPHPRDRPKQDPADVASRADRAPSERGRARAGANAPGGPAVAHLRKACSGDAADHHSGSGDGVRAARAPSRRREADADERAGLPQEQLARVGPRRRLQRLGSERPPSRASQRRQSCEGRVRPQRPGGRWRLSARPRRPKLR